MEETHSRMNRDNEIIHVQGVDCIVFLTPANVCINRCESRGDSHETIKPGMAKRVVGRMKKDLVLPNVEERNWRNLRFFKNYRIADIKKLVQEYT